MSEIFTRPLEQNWVRVTDWCDPEEPMTCQWSIHEPVGYSTWLRLEQTRRERKGNACRIQSHEGKVALFSALNKRWGWAEVPVEE